MRFRWIRAVLLSVGMVVSGCTAEIGPTISAPAAPSNRASAPSTAPPAPVTSSHAGTRPDEPSPSPTRAARSALTGTALGQAVDATAIRRHLDELERIATAHGGNRAAGTSGYEASVEYVAGRLEAAGYRVERHTFTFPAADGPVTSSSLLAERPGAGGADVVMLGAHLDSASHRAGINDNGSGSMTLLVVAERLADFASPVRTVRFAFWGAEEPGLHGSTAYVDELPPNERRRIVGYLNFDMLGSPNHVRFIYDDREAAPGSAAIRDLFADHFDAAGLAWDAFDLSGKSDHAPFSRAGIPTGGLFSGGGELKTDAQAASMGGTPGIPADACDDRACDTTANVSDVALDLMADAIAHVLVSLATD